MVHGRGRAAKWIDDVTTLPPLEVTRLADAAANAAGGHSNQPFGKR